MPWPCFWMVCTFPQGGGEGSDGLIGWSAWALIAKNDMAWRRGSAFLFWKTEAVKAGGDLEGRGM